MDSQLKEKDGEAVSTPETTITPPPNTPSKSVIEPQTQTQVVATTTATASVVPPQQQWVAMQYPAAAMVMPHQMPAGHYPMAAPHYLPYHIHHPVTQQPQQGGGAGGRENRTIWVGDLHNWMDEDYLRNCFASTGEVQGLSVT